MLNKAISPPCDCRLTRRRFVTSTAFSAAAASVARPWIQVLGAPNPPAGANPTSETLAATLHKSLTDEQRKALCFGFDDPLRSKVDNNWFITKQKIGTFLNGDQQDLVRQIFLKLHHPEYADTVLKATEHDNGKNGLGNCAAAFFGEPGSGKFEFVLTGRHMTRRCDGDSVAGSAFGGPIFYGHAAMSDNEKADHPGNAYWFQARRANEVFNALDGKQRNVALLQDARNEKGTETVRLKGTTQGLQGIRVGDMHRDQRDLVRRVMTDLLAPFRPADAAESMRLVEAAGFDDLHMAFFREDDIGNDGVWDIWQIEGPSMVWFFRGAPHVHVWVNIRDKGMV